MSHHIPATVTAKNLEGAFAGESMAFIKIAVKPRPSGRGCKAVTRKPPQGACIVSLMVTERSRSTELGLGKLFAKKED
jgi:hypothetical protein